MGHIASVQHGVHVGGGTTMTDNTLDKMGYNANSTADKKKTPDFPAMVTSGVSTTISQVAHQHNHNIPVEWTYIWNKKIPSTHPVAKQVVKLRCACGDEVDRG